jgi:hypothetical protein
MDFELVYLDVGSRFNFLIRAEQLTSGRLAIDMVTRQAAGGAAARSAMRSRSVLAPADGRAVAVNPPPLAVANAETMAPVAAVPLGGQAAVSHSIAEQRVAASGVRDAQLVEAFELVGVP